MTTAVQQVSRALITRTDFQRRGATENQRAGLRGMWGRSKPDSGILVNVTDYRTADWIPDPEPVERRDCPNCGKKDATVDRWPDRDILLAPWFRCCGAKA